jgi:choline dehydrogenase
MTAAARWDDVVVGAGSSGAVLASRLSECQGRKVLLIEAGAGRIDPDLTPHLLASPVLNGFNWDFTAFIGTEDSPRQYPYRLGKVIGGSSAVNGAIALHGLPADFHGWAAQGNAEWSWERVRPYFARIEADADFPGEAHGSSGPVPVRRGHAWRTEALAMAFAAACRHLGLPDLPDVNDGGKVGVGPVPSNVRDGQRTSAADAYLTPAAGRPNLSVWPGSQVVRIGLARGRVAGVEIIRGGKRLTVSAERVTLCAGAINTPVILQRSGIGPARWLVAAGIKPVLELPGVGRNLADHPVIAIWSVRRGSQQAAQPGHSMMARAATADGPPDISLTLATNAGVPDMPGIGAILGGRSCVSVSAMLLRPRSRGTVRIPSPAPDAVPVISLRLASAPGDIGPLMAGTRLAWSVVTYPAFAALLERPLLWTGRLVADDELLRDAIPRFVSPMWHAASTARMGPADDDLAVVDQRCQVHGIEGLRVVDASVMPALPSATPNLTCMMIAERVAEWMSQAA